MKSLGADQVIDYSKEDFTQIGQVCDAVFETVGGDVAKKSFAVLKPGGRLVVIDLAAHDPAATARLAFRWPGFDDARMAELMHEAGLQVDLAAIVPGPLEIRLWPALRGTASPVPHADPLDAQA